MQFTARKRRTPPAVIIVSLIDVLMVVLIFLMVTTTFRQQPAVKSALVEGKLRLHGWVYRLEDGKVQAFDQTLNQFVAVEDAVRQKLGAEVHEASSSSPLTNMGQIVDY